jgi:hypothetical protein
MTAKSKPLPLLRKRVKLARVKSDPRQLVSTAERKRVQQNLERMAEQHSAAATSTALHSLH